MQHQLGATTAGHSSLYCLQAVLVCQSAQVACRLCWSFMLYPLTAPVGQAIFICRKQHPTLMAAHRRGTNLAYELQIPQQPGPPQEAFKLKGAGSFVISIKVTACRSSQ